MPPRGSLFSKRIFSEAELDSLIKMYVDDKATCTQLERKFKAAWVTLRQELLNQNVVIRSIADANTGKSRTSKLAPFSKEIMSRYQNGESANRICKDFECSGDTVRSFLRFMGIEIRSREGRDGVNWKGGSFLSGDGYKYIWIEKNHQFNSMRTQGGYVLEHRLVMAEDIGRSLTSKETVHHKNGDRLDNFISNLQLRSSNHGPGQVRVCGDCGSHNILSEEL